MSISIVLLFIVLLFIAGLIVLQIFLSRGESKRPGLVLPIIAFFFGLLYPLCIAAPSEGITAGFIFQIILVWLSGNIPTILFLAIYWGCRGKQRRNKQLEKMNIQDLD